VDYNDLDRPAVERKRAQQQAAGGGGRQAVNTAEDLDFIDIPTFLRRQAD
jgi:cell division protein FtsZ